MIKQSTISKTILIALLLSAFTIYPVIAANIENTQYQTADITNLIIESGFDIEKYNSIPAPVKMAFESKIQETTKPEWTTERVIDFIIVTLTIICHIIINA